MTSLLFLTDSYKVTHHLQYPPGTTKVYSYFSSRGGKYDKIVFFGLQYIIDKYLKGSVIKSADVEKAKQLYIKHFSRLA